MAIDPSSILSLTWKLLLCHSSNLRCNYSGFIFGGDYILPGVDRYEVEYLILYLMNTLIKVIYSNEADLQVNDAEDAKVRIRAITRDGLSLIGRVRYLVSIWIYCDFQ